MLDVVDRGRQRALRLRGDAPGHLLRHQAGVLPDDGDDWNPDVRKDIDRCAQRRQRPDDQNDRTQNPVVLRASLASRPDLQLENGEFALRLREKVESFGATLKDRELEIFGARLTSEEPVTLVELAARFGVTRERVRQLEARIKGRLRTYLRAELGDCVEA